MALIAVVLLACLAGGLIYQTLFESPEKKQARRDLSEAAKDISDAMEKSRKKDAKR
jgi:hypothetical protein